MSSAKAGTSESPRTTAAVATRTRQAARGTMALIVISSFDRQRIDRRANRAGNRDCRRDEQEFVSLVGGAVVGQLLELEDLAHGHAHDRDRDPVPGLIDAFVA